MSHLMRPEGDERAEGVACLHAEAAHLAQRGKHGDGERALGRRLNLDLGHLERAECDVCEDLGRRGGSEPDCRLVIGGHLFASDVHVVVLKDFIETVLEETLEGVTDKGRTEAFPEAFGSPLRHDGVHGREETGVFSRVYLSQGDNINAS